LFEPTANTAIARVLPEEGSDTAYGGSYRDWIAFSHSLDIVTLLSFSSLCYLLVWGRILFIKLIYLIIVYWLLSFCLSSRDWIS
jgi:hypothetical protein